MSDDVRVARNPRELLYLKPADLAEMFLWRSSRNIFCFSESFK
jgi:hypothetical protein